VMVKASSVFTLAWSIANGLLGRMFSFVQAVTENRMTAANKTGSLNALVNSLFN
jgi:hypothetical protein